MIIIGATISLISGANGNLSSVSGYLPKNNISSNIESVLNEKREVVNPFILGVSVLGENSVYWDSEDTVEYFIGDYLSDNDGDFINPNDGEVYSYDFTLYGSNITTFTIAFDTLNNEHPKSIEIDGVEYFDDDAIFTISGLESADSHYIRISNWNKPNKPLVISGIYTEIDIEIDYTNLQSIEYEHMDRADTSLPSYGVISNYGTISFVDHNGEIKDYAEQLLLKEGLNTEIFVKNTNNYARNVLATAYTDKWTYDNLNKQVTVTLKDDLEEWQSINIERLNYDPRKSEENIKTGQWFYEYLWDLTPKKYNMLSFEELPLSTRLFLQYNTVKYPLLESSTLWSAWDKFCKVFLCKIYKTKDGKTTCVYGV